VNTLELCIDDESDLALHVIGVLEPERVTTSSGYRQRR
jgi:hypothetical protein